MPTPYPQIERWALPKGIVGATLNGVRAAGLCGKESGALWLGERAEMAHIQTVILPSGQGVEERSTHWRVAPEVFGTVTTWAKPRHLTLLAIAHTHMRGVPVRLSWADRYCSVQVPGVLAIVIGNGGADHDYREWGWFVYAQGEYRELLQHELAERLQIGNECDIDVWRADADGVWPIER